MKKLLLLLSVLFMVSACSQTPSTPSADAVEQRKTEQSLAQAYREVGMPNIINFKEKKDLKDLYELRDQADLVCYAYLMNERTGNIGQFLGECLGYGMPASAQFSNPTKYTDVYHGNGGSYGKFMPQAEPNGIFMPEGLSATWLKLIDPKTGEALPVYIEPAIIVSPFKLH